MYQLEVLNPVAQQRGSLETIPINTRPSTLDGKTIGLLWDGFGTGDEVLKRVGEIFRERFKDVRPKLYRGGHPAPDGMIAQVARECDVVVGGFAD